MSEFENNENKEFKVDGQTLTSAEFNEMNSNLKKSERLVEVNDNSYVKLERMNG